MRHAGADYAKHVMSAVTLHKIRRLWRMRGEVFPAHQQLLH